LTDAIGAAAAGAREITRAGRCTAGRPICRGAAAELTRASATIEAAARADGARAIGGRSCTVGRRECAALPVDLLPRARLSIRE
jgi:hypothetical protein